MTPTLFSVINVQLSLFFIAPSLILCEILAFLPSVICSPDEDEIEIDEIKTLYHDDLPQPDLLDAELLRWRSHWKLKWPTLTEEEQESLSSCATVIKKCSKAEFPNIYTLLQIVCTIPATSCECERSGSVLRRLHSYCRACMTQTRLSSLALIHINYDSAVSKEDIINEFIAMKPRRVAMKNVFSD